MGDFTIFLNFNGNKSNSMLDAEAVVRRETFIIEAFSASSSATPRLRVRFCSGHCDAQRSLDRLQTMQQAPRAGKSALHQIQKCGPRLPAGIGAQVLPPAVGGKPGELRAVLASQSRSGFPESVPT